MEPFCFLLKVDPLLLFFRGGGELAIIPLPLFRQVVLCVVHVILAGTGEMADVSLILFNDPLPSGGQGFPGELYTVTPPPQPKIPAQKR